MALTQVEYLLMLSEEAAEKGQELNERHHREALEHGQRLAHLRSLLNRAHRSLEAEERRFENYIPKPAPAPKVVSGGGKLPP